ncbi:MAG: hypothetical protein WC522_04585, partial [Candidatus Omnitrophota bacterium]
MKKIILYTMLVLSMLSFAIESAHAYTTFTNGNGVTVKTCYIRQGQSIKTIAGDGSGNVTVKLNSPYPNDNLKVGQAIVISGTTNYGTVAAPCTYRIASVTDQSNFTARYIGAGSITSTATNSTGWAGGDYTDLNTWVAGSDPSGNKRIEQAACYADWITEDPLKAFSGTVSITGKATTADYYLRIYTPLSERHRGVWDSSKFTIVVPSSGSAIKISNDTSIVNYVRLEGLQIYQNANNGHDGIELKGTFAAGANGVRIDKCILKGYKNTKKNFGIYLNNANEVKLTVSNSVMYYWKHGYHQASCGNNAAIKLYNCTVYDSATYGYYSDDATGAATATNCIACDNGNSGAQGFLRVSNTTCYNGTGIDFMDSANGDFRLVQNSANNTANIIGKGTDLSSAEIPDLDDIQGYKRSSSPWDIGANIGVVPSGTEFKCAIRASGATNPSADYNNLTTWVTALKGVDLTSPVTQVFPGSRIGTIADKKFVTLYRGGSPVNVYGMVAHSSASQILVTNIDSASPEVSFSAGDQWRVDGSNYFTINTDGTTPLYDQAIPVAECYRDLSPLNDAVTFQYGSGNLLTDSGHGLVVRAAEGSHHTGKAYTGFYIKSLGSVTPISLGADMRNLKIKGIELDMSGYSTGIQCGIGTTSPTSQSHCDNIEVAECLIHDFTATGYDGNNGIRLNCDSTSRGIKIYNNIIYNLRGNTNTSYNAGIYLKGALFDTAAVYNNTVYLGGVTSADGTVIYKAGYAYGIVTDSNAKVLAINNAVFTAGAANPCYSGTFDASSCYNCSSDSTAKGSSPLLSSAAADNFYSITSSPIDLHLKGAPSGKTTCANAGGKNLTNDTLCPFTTDADGETRPANTSPVTNNWNRGADEYIPTSFTWTGRAGTSSWDTPGNWDCGKLPTSTAAVIIPYTANSPVLNLGSVVTVKSLEISGGTLELDSGLVVTGDTSIAKDASHTGTLICDGGTITVKGNLTCAGGGVLTPRSNTITVGGNLDLSLGALTSSPASTIAMNGAAARTVTLDSTGTCNHLQFTGAGPFYFGRTGYAVNDLILANSAAVVINTGMTLTVNGAVNIGAGTTVTNNGSLILNGSSFTNNGTFTSDETGVDSVVTYQSSSGLAVDIMNGAYQYLEIKKSGATFNVPVDLAVNRNLTVSAGTLSVASGAELAVTGDLICAGTFDLKSSSTITVGGNIDFTDDSTLSCSASSAIIMNDSVASDTRTLTLGGASPVCYNLRFAGAAKYNFGNTSLTVNNLTLLGAVNVTIASGQALTINGTGTALNIGAGTTLTNNSNLYLAGTSFSNTGTFTSGVDSTVTYTGSSATIMSATYNNLTFNKSGSTFTLPADITVNKALTMTSGSINLSTYSLYVKGNWIGNGNTVTGTGAG